ncbi:MAG: hypothetical protein IJH42_03225, partial [Atopobiaceae bacterium]|nr:hypothetical protein [Atopobiaceae bacterium]
SMLRVDALDGDRPLDGAGCIIFRPRDIPIEGAQVSTVHEGEYATMYKRAMPYDVEPARKLIAWMRERGLKPARHVIDRCLLDATFYNDDSSADFCRLAIRIAE